MEERGGKFVIASSLRWGTLQPTGGIYLSLCFSSFIKTGRKSVEFWLCR